MLFRLIRDGDDVEIVPYARYLQGQVLAGLKRWDDIQEVLSPLAESESKHSLQLAARFWIAESHYRLGDFDLARQDLYDLADLTKGNRATWVPMIPLRLAQIKALPASPPNQKDQRDWEDALQLVDSIGLEFPNFPQQFEVEYVRGQCLMALLKIDEARTAFQQAKNAPEANGTETQAMAHWRIGESYYQQRQWERALAEYEGASKSYKSYPLWQAHALYGAGLASEKLGRKQQAVDYYKRILREFSNHDESLNASTEDRLRKNGVDINAFMGSRQANRVPSIR
ncbi:MAG: tetratricopeptide repeat protein [Planctomycetota bacterium]|nr:tetratricopeptide repeat protein [Planctomycetota bacterium]